MAGPPEPTWRIFRAVSELTGGKPASPSHGVDVPDDDWEGSYGWPKLMHGAAFETDLEDGVEGEARR